MGLADILKRKRAQLIMKEKEKKFTKIMENGNYEDLDSLLPDLEKGYQAEADYHSARADKAEKAAINALEEQQKKLDEVDQILGLNSTTISEDEFDRLVEEEKSKARGR